MNNVLYCMYSLNKVAPDNSIISINSSREIFNDFIPKGHSIDIIDDDGKTGK